MTLPSSIEAHLSEAGFTQTELLILRACIDGAPVSLRELAAQSKKSTGVLDQAMKKLMRRKIMVRKKVNGVPKFALASMDAVLQWIEEDVQQKTEGLLRRKQDFKSFVRALQQHDSKPKVEYFEGDEGIARAYNQLLENNSEELLQFLPLDCHEDTACFSQQRVESNRERRRKNMKLRVIAHDTVFDKRFKERDALEQRETKLVSESRCAIDFEKIISGNTVACFNCAEKTAYFINFPELAQSERNLFEMVWGITDVPVAKQAANLQKEDKTIALRKGLYEFFCTKKSIASLFGLVASAALITGLLYANNVRLNTQRMRDQVIAIAATGAGEIDVEDVNAIHTEADIVKPEWEKLVNQLIGIRDQNPDVRFVYILRETSDPNTFEFVADADSMDPYAVIDLNNDGIIDDADALNPPGDPYDVSDIPGAINGLKKPYADPKPYQDQWGTFISGHAPIKDELGNTVAVLGVDRIAKDVHQLTRESFSLIGVFLIALLCLLVARLYFFYQSLFSEVKKCCINYKRIFQASIFYFACAAIVTGLLYQTHLHLNTQRIRDKITSVAATAALQIDAADVNKIHVINDAYKPEYAKLVTLMDTIRKQNDQILYIYLIRPTAESGLYEFVADADAIDPFTPIDTDGDGEVTEADQLGVPGLPYDVTQMDALMEGEVTEPVANSKPYTDKWGSFYTAYAPIKNQEGQTIALLAVDMWASKVKEFTQSEFHFALVLPSIFSILFALHVFFFERVLLLRIIGIFKKKSVMYAILSMMVLSLLITLGMYKYTLEIMKDEIGNRLMSIAATAAPEIDANDLKNLNFARDMKTEAYQRVFNKLNEIRDNNEDVTYVYVMKPAQEGMFQFVADADSNYFLPDPNDPDPVDVVPPGMYYDSSLFGKKYANTVMKKPVAEEDFMVDQWGTLLIAAAPIYNEKKQAVAFLGLDMDVTKFKESHKAKFKIWNSFIAILILLFIAKVILPTGGSIRKDNKANWPQ